VVHFLKISVADLKTIWDNGKDGGADPTKYGGARLYFCNEPSGDFNIIMVPVDNTGNNVLSAGGKTAVVNKLDPCPDQCMAGKYSDKPNNITDLNYDKTDHYWYKPNFSDGMGHHWVDANNNIITTKQ
jgi:hypothetical protein